MCRSNRILKLYVTHLERNSGLQTCIPYLLDLRVQLLHLLHSTSIIVRTSDCINSVFQICGEAEASTPSVTVNYRIQPVTLRGNPGEVFGKLLKVHLLLIPKFEDFSIRMRVRQKRVEVNKERIRRSLCLRFQGTLSNNEAHRIIPKTYQVAQQSRELE